MIQFNALIEQFGSKGEKTGWTYLAIPAAIAKQLKPGNKKFFRIKGRLDQYPISGMALVPMGGGDFILPLNANVRKGINKKKGEWLAVEIEEDTEEKPLLEELMLCLEDEPAALRFFNTLSKGHQRYFSSWIAAAKTETTRTRRLSQAVRALAMGLGYPQMIRMNKKAI